LVYSGRGRSANSILQKQQEGMTIDPVKFNAVRKGRDKAYEGFNYLKKGDLDSFGNMFHEAWIDKKATESSITNEYFDSIYDKAIKAGAIGGKLLGAGGGGFFLFYVPGLKKYDVEQAIASHLACYWMEMDQNQQECYDINDDRLLKLMPDIVEIAHKTGNNILETKIYIPC